MKIKLIKSVTLIFIATWAVLSFSCQRKAEKEEPGKGELLLKSGFEQGVEISADMRHLSGSDTKYGTWDSPGGWVDNSRFVYITNEGKSITDFMESAIEVMTGPKGNETRVLRMTNIADDPDHTATSRNEFSFFGKQAPDDYKEGYVKYWMKLQDLNDLVSWEEKSPWYMIMEWKEPNSHQVKSQEECEICCKAGKGGTNNYRINIGIQKDSLSHGFNWIFTGEHPQPCRVTEWTFQNKDIQVPLDEWFLVEAYMKKDTVNGRVWFSVNNHVVLDTDITRPEGFIGRTTHPDNPMVLKFWSPMKNYHDMEWNKNGPVSQWYDDFELWTGFPAGHPELK